MIHYTNAFRCATSHSGTEVVINFLQESPVIQNDGKITEVTLETVSTLVMNADTADNLIRSLQELKNSSSN